MQVVIDGLLTHYEQSGHKGRRLLLLHGWGDRLETFDTLVAALGKSYRITRLDLPGFGTTEPPKVTWGLGDYAKFIDQFVHKLSLTPDVIVGHSNGGALAIVISAQQTKYPKQIVLLASAGIRNRHGLRRVIWKLVAKLGKVVTFWLPTRYKKRLQKRFYGTIGSDMFVAPHLQETFKRTVAEDISNIANQIDIPTLLIYGKHDRATPLDEVGEPLRMAIPSSKLEVIPGADHFVHQRAPEQVARLIREFVS